MNDIEIHKLIMQDQFSSNFVGVFSRTRIPLSNSIPAGYIVNLDDFSEPGSHWIGIYITDKYYNVFDSYGRNLNNDSYISSFLRSYANKREYTYSPFVLQQNTTSTCGLFCILFILIMSRGYTLNEFINIFNLDNQKCNDEAIVKYFSEKYKKDFTKLLNEYLLDP